MKQCKCEHWQECPVCQPRRFDANGNRLPPEPTPLQAARAQIESDEALLRQALEGIELHLRHHERGCVFLDEIALALRERLGETK